MNKKSEEQKDLVDVKKDEVGIAADKYLALKDEKNRISKDMDEAEKTLIDALIKVGRKYIKVGAFSLSISIVESKTKIKVAKG